MNMTANPLLISNRSALPTRPAPAAGPDGGELLKGFFSATQRLYGRIAGALARTGLSYPEYQVLTHLHAAKSGVELAALAAALGYPRSEVECLVDRLTADGRVLRVQATADRPTSRAALTPLGSATVEEGATAVDRVASRFAASFSAREWEQLERLLSRIPTER